MSAYRHGITTGFFDGTTTYNSSTNVGGGVSVPNGPATYSAVVDAGRDSTLLIIYLAASAACTFQVQVAHEGNEDFEGIFPDEIDQTYVWCDLYNVTGTATQIVQTATQPVAVLIPFFEPVWLRLRRVDTTGSLATITSGFSLMGM